MPTSTPSSLLFGLAALFLWTATSQAQEVSTIRIFTEPAGVKFLVDGNPYYTAVSFAWPKGSKHVVSVETPIVDRQPVGGCFEAGGTITTYDELCTKRFRFGGWDTNKGASGDRNATTHIVTADPAITYVRGTFGAEYRVWIAGYEAPANTAEVACSETNYLGTRPVGAGPGIVFVGDVCVAAAKALWLAPGDYNVSAIPYDGYAFRGWNMSGTVTSSYIAVAKIGGPTTLHPMFEPAKRVRIYTQPPEMQVRVDRSVINTSHPSFPSNARPVAGFYDWLKDSVHILGAPSPQRGHDGKLYVFDSWSNGGTQDMRYDAGNDLAKIEELTAIFARAVPGSVLAHPQGLRVKVDGRENFPANTFAWKVGTKFTVSAPSEQIDASGRKYTFRRWSNGGAATQEILADESSLESGIRLVAEYEALPQAILRASVPGARLKVDGVDCASPCKLDRPAGSAVRVSVPARVPISEVSRYEFNGWSDGNSAERVVTFDRDTQTLTANYMTANRLIATADPEEGATFRLSPHSPDGFYPEGTTVSVTVEPNPGFQFRRWHGDLSGNFRSGTVEMRLSRTVRAALNRVRFVNPAGVRNAAGETPIAGVAPGSLASIYGANLSQATEAVRGTNLSQTLGGLTLMIGDRLLPLVYVSPEQINAQIPGDLAPGKYTLSIRGDSTTEVKTEFEVVRNAPGLFSQNVEGVAYAIALHEDGTQVTPENPARRNEVVTVTGTGFGPYDPPVVDGFTVPSRPVHNLLDPVDVRLGDRILPASWAGAQPGLPGVAAVKVVLGDGVSGVYELQISVNGASSNVVMLPVE